MSKTLINKTFTEAERIFITKCRHNKKREESIYERSSSKGKFGCKC